MQARVRAGLAHHIGLGNILPVAAVLWKSFLMSSKSAMVAAMGSSPLFTDQLFCGSKRILGNKKGLQFIYCCWLTVAGTILPIMLLMLSFLYLWYLPWSAANFQTKNLTHRKFLKPLNRYFHYNFPKQSCLDTPLPPFINQPYIILPKFYCQNCYLKMSKKKLYIYLIAAKFTQALLMIIVAFRKSAD